MRLILRVFIIPYIFIRNGAFLILPNHPLSLPFKLLGYLNPYYWFAKKPDPGPCLKNTLEGLGPLFVKFGQILSTRQDLVPEEVGKELAKLQDCVSPFSTRIAINTITKAFKKPLGELFVEFSEEPLAAASIAQVHAAKLLDGTEVVVKILRPHIKSIIRSDLKLLYILTRILEALWPHGRKHARPSLLAKEFAQITLNELDLQREAGNAALLRRYYEHNPDLYIPEVFWDYTRKNILVLERIYGTPISNMEAIKAANMNTRLLAEKGLDLFFTQVFTYNFFHADMHPGNIMVDTSNPDRCRYLLVDFGIVGSLSEQDRKYIAENLLAFFNRDYHRVAVLHQASGWISEDINLFDFEAAIRTVSEPIFNKPLKEIAFSNILLQLLKVARSFRINIQPQLFLLQKTLFNIEGLTRQLDPNFDLWSTVKPFLDKWVRSQKGFKALRKNLCEEIPFWIEYLPQMPRLLHSFVESSAKPVKKEHHKLRYFLLGFLSSAMMVAASSLLIYSLRF